MAIKPADDAHSLVRYVRKQHCQRDADNNVIGILYVAFDLRPNETYLSTSCLEKAGGEKTEALTKIKKCLATKFKLAGGALTVGQVDAIKKTFAPHKVKITVEPKHWNEAYTAVRQLPLERLVALERLARESWADWVKIEDLE